MVLGVDFLVDGFDDAVGADVERPALRHGATFVDDAEGLGRLLIALRIFQGLSQRELADKLTVHESQVSRDERNEYHGVTVERANRILEALGAELRTAIVTTPHRKANSPKIESVLIGS